MSIEIVPFGGWKRNLLIQNGSVELLVTLDVGPRVLRYQRSGGTNVFKIDQENLGGSGESEWIPRGGHRIWLSPEDEAMSYALDNKPIQHVVHLDGSVTFITPACAPWQIRKEITIKLDETGSGVEVRHSAINESGPPIEVATWALTVMNPGGVEIVPLPPIGEHPRDLQPNRLMVVWPYTDMADPRWKFGRRFVTLRQFAEGLPTKIGMAHRLGWVGYLQGRELFMKSFPWESGLPYPDGGCNFETFTNAEMLEVESLGPLTKLSPGQSCGHTERWNLFETDGNAPTDDEDALAEWLEPFVKELPPEVR